jgi:hypothetical protein
MQPTFLPWQGYFALIGAADVFVFLDDFQFQRHSFHQRNRLRLADGSEAWIAVPVAKSGAGGFPPLSAAVPQLDDRWRKRLKATLDQSYGRAPFHAQLRGDVDAWIDGEWTNLADLNIAFITWAAGMLGLPSEFRRSSEIGSSGERSARVLELLRRAGAGSYLSARGSFEYMADDGVFPVDDVDVAFQDFRPQPYSQRRASSFVSHLSVLDALFEVGPSATRALVLEGQRAWIPWRDMVAMTAATRAAP